MSVCVGTGRKQRRPRFSRGGSNCDIGYLVFCLAFEVGVISYYCINANLQQLLFANVFNSETIDSLIVNE